MGERRGADNDDWADWLARHGPALVLFARQWAPSRADARPRSWGSNASMSQNSVQHVGDGGAGGETMPLGQIAIRASISTTFDLVPDAPAGAE